MIKYPFTINFTQHGYIHHIRVQFSLGPIFNLDTGTLKPSSVYCLLFIKSLV